MNKVFHAYVADIAEVRPVQLDGDQGTFLFTQEQFRDARIYFIVKRDQSRFIFDKMSINPNGEIQFVIEIGNKTYSKPVDYHYVLKPELSKIIKSETYFGTNIDEVRQAIEKHSDRYKMGFVFDLSSRQPDSLEAIVLKDGEKYPHLVTCHAIAQYFGFYQNHPAEIVYIGQSKEIKDRVTKHEYIQKALARYDRYYDVKVCFLTLESSIFEVRIDNNNIIPIKTISDNFLSNNNHVTIIERVLINHFVPEYNRLHTRTPLHRDDLIKPKLTKRNYIAIKIDLDFDDAYWTFGTDNVNMNKQHRIEVKFSK